MPHAHSHAPPSIPRELGSLSAAEFESIMQLKKLQAKAASEAKDARNAERDFEAIELEAAAANPVAPSVPASVSALHRPCPARGSTLTPLHCPTPQRQCATQRHACAAVPRVLVSLRDTPAPVPA